MRICFDMDGTIANLYGVENWLEYLIAEDVKPYAEAEVMLNMNSLARLLNKLQKQGNEIVIISSWEVPLSLKDLAKPGKGHLGWPIYGGSSLNFKEK